MDTKPLSSTLSGGAEVTVGAQKFQLAQCDAIYAPPGSHIEVKTGTHVDIAGSYSDVENHYPVQFGRQYLSRSLD